MNYQKTPRYNIPHKPKITAKGTELPVQDIKGKPYLAPAYRVIWFREDHPDWTLETELEMFEGKAAMVKAYIKNEEGRIISMGTKTESKAGFAAFVEKAETGAIGRALAFLGYGTEAEPDLHEGDEVQDLCDTPKAAVKKAPQPK